MTIQAITRFVVLVALATTIPATAPLAGDHHKHHHDDQDSARAAVRDGKIFPLTKILAIVAKREPGTVIKVELESERKLGLIYEIKVLTTKGRVRKLKLDARTGKILKIKDD